MSVYFSKNIRINCIKSLDKRGERWYNLNKDKTEYKGKAIKCKCGKLIGYERNGAVYIRCRGCRHEHKIEIAKEP